MLVPVGMCALRDRRGGGGGGGGEREGGSRIAYAQEIHSIPRKDRGPRMHPCDEGVPAAVRLDGGESTKHSGKQRRR